MGLLTTAVAVAGLVGGAYVGLLTYRNDGIRRAIATTETTPAPEVRPNTTAEVDGEVALLDESVTPLLPAENAVCCVWRVDVWDESDGTSTFSLSASGVTAVPFAVADGAGEQRVEVGDHHHRLGGAGVSLETLKRVARAVTRAQDPIQTGFASDDVVVELRNWDRTVEVEPGDPPPETVAAFVERSDALGPTAVGKPPDAEELGHHRGRRRYRQAVLTAGDEGYALGPVDADGVMRPDGDQLVVGQGTEAELLAKATRRVRQGGVAALVLTLVGAGALVAGVVLGL